MKVLERLDELSRAELQDVVQQLVQRVESLEFENSKLSRMLFAPRTERRPLAPIDTRQGSLFGAAIAALEQRLQDAAEIETDRSPQPRRKPRRRAEFPKDLPRIETVCELPEEARRCSCGALLEDMGADEVTEILERVEYSCVHEIHRKKYCCRGCQSGVTVAPGPTRVVEKGLLGNSFLAHVLVERFQHHMPYHRQETKYSSEGLPISRSVLCESTGHCAEVLAPVFEALKDEIRSADYLKADETHAILQESSDGTSKKAYFWAYLDPKSGVVFDFQESRDHLGPSRMLQPFQGYLQIDGYAGYNEVCDRPGVTRAGCWAHVRRKFVDAKTSDGQFAKEAIGLIGRVYDLDRWCRSFPIGDRFELRKEYMPPLLQEFREWLELRTTQVLKSSPIGEAIHYAKGQWPALVVFLEDGRIDLDNNTVEQMMRHIAVGRKNWMTIGNRNGGDRAALFYSLVQTCKLLELNPREYLFDVLVRAKEGEDPRKLTPARWAEARRPPPPVPDPVAD